MKEISNDLWGLRNKLYCSWNNIIPRYLNLWVNDLFEIDSNIFDDMVYIIGDIKF